MPINQPPAVKRGGLTSQQKFEQQAAVYGLNPKDYQMTPQMNLTVAEIERMRSIVLQADTLNKGGMQEFDLAKPPTPPYRFQEFPKCLYAANGKTVHVDSPEQEAEYLGRGYALKPHPVKQKDESEFAGLSASDKAEARQLDEALGIAPAPRRGRPRSTPEN